MAEETGKHEGEDIAIEDSEKEDYMCKSCGKKVDTVYFYCEECHRIQKDRHRKEHTEEEKEVIQDGKVH